jgi:tetratricopeptide (TPR) repeat protein
MRRVLHIALAVTITVAGLYAAAALADPEPPVMIRTGSPDPVELERLIREGDRLLGVERSHLNLFHSGSLYLARARSTMSIDDYLTSRLLLEEASSIDADPATSLALASVRLALHDFTAALDAIDLIPPGGPEASMYDGLRFDVLIGLGRLSEAEEPLRRLELQFPDEPAVMIRSAQLAFLTGRGAEAAELARSAARRADGLPDREASFYLTVAGRYAFAAGRLEDAAGLMEKATKLDERSAPAWLGLARAQAATGDPAAAIGSAERAAALVPEPDTLAFLADLYSLAGDPAASENQLRTIDAIAALGRPVYRRGVLEAWLAHDRHLDEALELARAEVAERPDQRAHLLLAMALHSAGRTEEAGQAVASALGPADAYTWYQAGAIALAGGDLQQASVRFTRSLELNPAFHPILADRARQTLERLEQ